MDNMLTLAEYEKIGEKIISKYLSIVKKRPPNFSYDELLGEIITQLAYADHEYDPAKSSMTLTKYRGQQAIIAIKQVNTRNARYRKKVLRYHEGFDPAKQSVVDEIHKTEHPSIAMINYAKAGAGLTQLQKEHIDLFLEGKTYSEIALIYNTSLANTWQIFNSSFRKMRGVLNVGKRNDKT
jgi:DNA-binding CsgD family transcriptional regulator